MLLGYFLFIRGEQTDTRPAAKPMGGGLMKHRLTGLRHQPHTRVLLGLASLGIALTLVAASVARTQGEAPTVPQGLSAPRPFGTAKRHRHFQTSTINALLEGVCD